MARTEARLHAPACRGADLIISAGGRSGVAAGTVYSRLTITNSSRRPCTVAGVPRVEAIDRRGNPVGRAEGVPSLRAGSRGRRLRVRLRGDGSATFTVTHYNGIGSGRCKTALTYGLRVTVPGTGPTQVVPLPLSYCPSPRGGLRLRSDGSNDGSTRGHPSEAAPHSAPHAARSAHLDERSLLDQAAAPSPGASA